jgi:hypothetical protein
VNGPSTENGIGLQGRQVRLKPRGAGRFFASGFLIFWLCGWAAGEVLALWVLVRGAISLITGEALGSEGGPVAPGPAIAVGVFMVVWLTLWTIGGICAIRELLKMLWAEDRISTASGLLSVSRRLGPRARN